VLELDVVGREHQRSYRRQTSSTQRQLQVTGALLRQIAPRLKEVCPPCRNLVEHTFVCCSYHLRGMHGIMMEKFVMCV
jgi:hypothetical protein